MVLVDEHLALSMKNWRTSGFPKWKTFPPASRAVEK